MEGVVSCVTCEKVLKAFSLEPCILPTGTHLTNWKTRRHNSPSKVLQVGESSVPLRRPVVEISDVTNTRTDTHTQNTAINIIDGSKVIFSKVTE